MAEHEAVVVLEVQPHGGALLRSGGPGRPKSQAAEAINKSRRELQKCLDALIAIRDAGACKHCGRGASDADEIVKATMGIMRLAGIDKVKPRPSKRSTFSVVTATPAEQAEKMQELAAEPELAEPDPVPGAPR